MGCDRDRERGREYAAISIHAARMGCDCRCRLPPSGYRYFNPRSPNGLRLLHKLPILPDSFTFQSTQPEWAATKRYKKNASKIGHFNPRSPNGLRRYSIDNWNNKFWISIHAARMGCDLRRRKCCYAFVYFNPRSPNGLRLKSVDANAGEVGISIHAARMGCDKCGRSNREYTKDFNPRSPNGLRLMKR